MNGIKKLSVPETPKQPKLFVITCQRSGENQTRHSIVDFDLASAIVRCYGYGKYYTIHNYIIHVELTVSEINSKFKNFNP